MLLLLLFCIYYLFITNNFRESCFLLFAGFFIKLLCILIDVFLKSNPILSLISILFTIYYAIITEL